MDIIELLKAIVIGIVEGVTEWLPVSSTGHMIVVDDFIQLNVSPAFMELFLVVIQLGAILAVIVLYFRRLNPFARAKTAPERRATWRLWGKVLLACAPAAAVGFLLDSWVEAHFFNAVTVALALVVYGVAFILVEKIAPKPLAARPVGRHSPGAAAVDAGLLAGNRPLYRGAPSAPTPRALSVDREPSPVDVASPADHPSPGELDRLSVPRALGIGCFQCLAIIPGTSRSGSTILGGLILGVSRATAAEFSFFLAIPVMFGWSLLKLAKALLGGVTLTQTEWGVFATGIVVAFVVSIFSIRFLMGFIKKHSFAAFGWYRIVLGIALIAYFALSGRLLLS